MTYKENSISDKNEMINQLKLNFWDPKCSQFSNVSISDIQFPLKFYAPRNFQVFLAQISSQNLLNIQI